MLLLLRKSRMVLILLHLLIASLRLSHSLLLLLQLKVLLLLLFSLCELGIGSSLDLCRVCFHLLPHGLLRYASALLGIDTSASFGLQLRFDMLNLLLLCLSLLDLSLMNRLLTDVGSLEMTQEARVSEARGATVRRADLYLSNLLCLRLSLRVRSASRYVWR